MQVEQKIEYRGTLTLDGPSAEGRRQDIGFERCLCSY